MDKRRWIGIALGAAVLLCPVLATGMPSHAGHEGAPGGHHAVEETLSVSMSGVEAVDPECCHHDGAGVPAAKTFAPAEVAPFAAIVSGHVTPRSPGRPGASEVSFARAVVPLRC